MDNNPILKNDPKGDEACCAFALAWKDIKTTEKISGISEAVGGGPEDPLADVATIIINVGGLAKAGWDLFTKDDKPVVQVKTEENQNKEEKKFNGQKDTKSETQHEAFNKAKEQNGIPRSQQPDKTNKVDEVSKGKPTGKKLREYNYTKSEGKKVTIRRDNPTKYPEGGKGDQGNHYNAGETGKKLKQHHDFDN
jgi:hypothetical protein